MPNFVIKIGNDPSVLGIMSNDDVMPGVVEIRRISSRGISAKPSPHLIIPDCTKTVVGFVCIQLNIVS